MREIPLDQVRVGDRVQWKVPERGGHGYGFGNVLKINRTSFNCTDAKFGTSTVFQVSKKLVMAALRPDPDAPAVVRESRDLGAPLRRGECLHCTPSKSGVHELGCVERPCLWQVTSPTGEKVGVPSADRRVAKRLADKLNRERAGYGDTRPYWTVEPVEKVLEGEDAACVAIFNYLVESTELQEALSDADEKRVEQIVRRVLKTDNEIMIRKMKGMLVSFTKALYIRRGFWKDMLSATET